jgi:hypothetical protein
VENNLCSGNGHYLKTQAKHNQFTKNGNPVAVRKLYSNNFSLVRLKEEKEELKSDRKCAIHFGN